MAELLEQEMTAERWSRAYAAGRSASIDSLLHDIESAL